MQNVMFMTWTEKFYSWLHIAGYTGLGITGFLIAYKIELIQR